MYIKNAFYYWRKHKNMYVSMVVTIALGIMAVMIAALLVRSQIVTKLEETLNNGGFYDIAIYDVSDQVKEELRSDERFESVGIVYCLGQAVSENGMEFPIGVVENKETEDMLHLIPIEGRYPEKEGEITLDRITMQCMGIKPKVGEVIQLQLKSKDKELASREYKVVGIIEQRYMSEWGKVYTRRRYAPMDATEESEDYSECPYAYIYSSEMDLFKDTEQEVLLANVKTGQDYGDSDVKEELLDKYGDNLKADYNELGRSHYANTLLGYKAGYEGSTAVYSYQEALDRIGSESTEKDFYSRVMIPLFSMLIAIITFFSLYEAFGSFILSRKKEIGMYRCLGMNQKQVLLMVAVKLLFIIVPGVLIGCIGGILGYGGILYVMDHILGLHIRQAIWLPEYFAPFIKAATVSPYISSIGLSLIAVLFSIVTPLIKCAQLSPLEVCRKEGASQKERMKYRLALGINVCVLIVSVTIGYLYFASESRFENEQLTNTAEECLIDGSDYMMEKTFDQAGLWDEVRHDAGITRENIKLLEENSMVERVHKAIVCNGTHLIYNQEEVSSEISEFLESALYEYIMFEDTEDERWYASVFEKHKEYVGFTKKEDIYRVPAIALDEQEWSRLSSYIVDGEIHQDALRKGEEVVLVYSGEEDIPYQVGDELPMNVVIYSKNVDESEDYSKNKIMKDAEPIIPADGKHPAQYFYGERQDWKVRVGAILCIDNTSLLNFYSGEYSFGLLIFTRTEAFEAWNMPDKNYTKVAVNLSKDADIVEFEILWYQLLSQGKIMTMRSLERIKDELRENIWSSRVIFLALSGMMIIISLLGILNALHMQVLQEKRRISIYRALGVSKREMRRKQQKKQLLMVVIGAALAEGTTVGILLLRSYLDKVIDAYCEGTINKELDWWGFNFPFTRIGRLDCVVAIVVSLIMFLLMALVVGCMYQRTINRQTIAEGLREE